jgi:hypothetical protein
MRKAFVYQLLLVWLLLLSACSRDVMVSTVLQDTGGLRPGDKVYLASREVGSVERIRVTEQTPGFTVEFALYPEHAELVQANAVAYLPLKSPPMLMLLNSYERMAPVAPGGRLKGLSPLEAAIWQANDAAVAASDFLEQLGQQVDGYFQSEDWAKTRAQIDAGISKLAADSEATAERIAEDLRLLIESLAENAATGTQALEESATEIEAEIARLEAEGREELANSLRRLLRQIEALEPSEREPATRREALDAV